jgi:hypothetical protein
VPFVVESVIASIVPSFSQPICFATGRDRKYVRKLQLGVSDCYNTCLRLDGERGKHQDKVRERAVLAIPMLCI